MAVISINYTEPNPESYESVSISYLGEKSSQKIFNSGNFIKDWYNLNKWIAEEADGELKNESHFSNSSSIDHFIMDGANVISRYLKIKDGKPLLEKEYDFMDEGTEMFIPEGEDWTWEQLKEYVKNES
jgi:hypothetical protein